MCRICNMYVAYILAINLSFYFHVNLILHPHTKGDQTGDNSYGKHVYANPDLPCCCPVLAFAVMLFCFNGRENTYQHLFAGSNGKDRFSEILEGI